MDRTRHINIANWNSNGLTNKMGEVINFIHNHGIDILIITETKLQTRHKIKIKNFTIHRRDRPVRRGGGVMIAIHNRVPHRLLQPTNSDIEHVSVQIGNDTTITAAYNPPDNLMTDQDLDALVKLSNKTLTIGDFNARHRFWNNHQNNRNGNTLLDYTINNNVTIIAPDAPTHHPQNGMTPTYIDLTINRNVTQNLEPTVLNELNSDHLPVIFTLKNVKINDTQRQTYLYDNNTDWNKYRRILNENTIINNNITTGGDLDIEIAKITENIQKARDEIAKKFTLKPQEDRIPQTILNKIRIKNGLRRQWQRHRRTEDRNRLNELQNEIRTDIQRYKNLVWTNKLRNLNVRDNSLWKMTSQLRKNYITVTTLENTTDQTYAYSDKDKAKLLAEHFERVYVCTPDETQEQKNITETMRPAVTKMIPDRQTMEKLICRPNEILEIIKKLANKKAPGPDEISNILLKRLPLKTIVQLTYIINSILKLQHFPSAWKQAIIIPILKPGKNSADPNSYRPISLLNTLSKVAERVILNRLKAEQNKLNIRQDEQFGFQETLSTELPVAKLGHDIITGFNKQQNTVLLLLDMEKAFDTVWHEGLLYKLKHVLGFSAHMTNLLKSYLTNRSFVVRVNNTQSVRKNTSSGVPQGTVLAPKLYTLYTTDIPKYTSTKTLLFADDTAIYATSYYAEVANKHIKYHLMKLLPYYKHWKIKINANKTEIVIFTQKFTNNKIREKLKINDVTIQDKITGKYLGITLDYRLSFVQQISNALKRTYLATRGIYPLIAKNSELDTNNKILLYKTIIRPILTYGSNVWHKTSATQKHRMQIYQNKILRTITNSNRYTNMRRLHQQINVQKIEEFIDDKADKFYRNTILRNNLTRDIASIRHNNDQIIKHKYLHQRLPLFFEPP